MPDLDQEYEALSKELRSTNLQLGLPEFDGLGSPVDAEYEALSRELAMLPQTYDEWLAEEREKDKRSAWQATKTFASNILTGANAMLDEGKKAVGEVVGGKAEWKDVKRGVWDLGRHDFWRFAETLGGAAMDKLWGTGAEAEGRREYQRYRENFDYYQKVRPAIVEATGTKAKALVRTLGEFTDPTMIIPIAGPTLKVAAAATKSARLAKLSKALDKSAEIVSMPARGTAAVTRKAIKGTAAVTGKLAGVGGRAGGLAAKAAALPRTITSRVAKELGMERDIGGALIAGQISGAIAGLPFVSSFGAVEVAGLIANKTGRGLEKVLSTLSQPSGQVRFLERLARTAETPRRRKLALLAHKMGFTRAGDAAFNMLVNGVSVGTLNAALAYASGERAEGIGQAVGAGAVMGGVMPFGQPGQVGGKAQTSREATSINYLEAKWASDQLKDFRGMTPEARLAFATSEEAGIRAPGVTFVDKKIMLELQRQDDPNSREPQNAFWDETNYRIYVNRDGSMKKGSIEAMEILFHELGHTFTAQAAKDDPFFLRSILTEYEAEPGEKSYRFSFTKDRDGNPIDYVDVNQEGKDFADAYSSISDDPGIGVGDNAKKLAHEIAADQFAMMMADDPNLFRHINPSVRQKVVESGRKILSLFGVVDNLGNPLTITIRNKKGNPMAQRSPTVRKLFRNYVKQRERAAVDKVKHAKKGTSVELKKGETADQGVERLFGAQGISLKDAGKFIIRNKQITNELRKIRDRIEGQSEGGWVVIKKQLYGKRLTPEMRKIFERLDTRGSIRIALNDLEEAIASGLQLNFYYRSGKPSKYSNNELKVRVVSPVGLAIRGIQGKTPGLYLQAIDEAYLRNNIEVLVREGLISDPDAFIRRAREVAERASEDPEGRINPEGRYENEIVTAAMGHKESAPSIRDPKLRQLLEDGKLQDSYRSYHVGSLAAPLPTGKVGIGFNWDNIKYNYLPHDRLYMPAESKGRPEKILLRTSPEVKARAKEVAKERGISMNDALNVALEESLLAGKTPVDKQGEGDISLKLTPKEEALLAKTKIGPAEAEAYRAAMAKKKRIAYRDLGVENEGKLFMPASNARLDFERRKFAAPRFQRWVTKGGKQTPELAVKVGDKFEPFVFFHGGDVGREAPTAGSRKTEGFKPTSDEEGRWTFDPKKPVWLARNEWFAMEYSPAGRKPLALVTRAKKIFNAADPSHRRQLERALGKKVAADPTLSYKGIMGDPALSFAKELESLGFDGIWETQYRGEDGSPEAYAKRLADDSDFFERETSLVIFDGKNVKLASDHEVPVSGEFTEGGRLYMPAESIEQRKASKYGRQFRQAVQDDKLLIARARKDWIENGFKAGNFQAWIKGDNGSPALAVEKEGIFVPVKLYYGGPLGTGRRPGFKPGAILDAIRKPDYAEGVTRQGEERYSTSRTIELTPDRKLAIAEQKASAPGVKPLEFATNAEFIFDPSSIEHVSMLADSIRKDDPKSPDLDVVYQLERNPEDVFSYENLLREAGWHGYKLPDGYAIFDAKRVKLISDQAGEGQFFTKDRAFGRVSGLFGRPLPSERMSAMGPSERRRDVRFMPAESPLGLSDNIRDVVLPGIKQDKFSRGQLEAALGKTAGARAYADEIGLIDWLKDRKSVTKAEVDAFVDANAPRLEEKVLGGISGRLPGGRIIPSSSMTKFSEYQEPGGTNYREVLVKLPPPDWHYAGRRDVPSPEAESKVYHDPHFNEGNVLLHLRLNDRIDADGKKVLFIEELQSDWHQKGRKDGYRLSEREKNALRQEFADLAKYGSTNPRANRRRGEIVAELEAQGGLDYIDTTLVPDAPFKKNWPALGLKRVIREALENGYDRVAWLDGEGQAARYDLSQRVVAIEVFPEPDGTYEITARLVDQMGGEYRTLATKVPKEKLADHIGKEPAQKALEKIELEKKQGEEMPLAHLEGLDLKVGGEGMKAFYDRELVSIANKISKKIGGGKVRRENLRKIPALERSREFGSHVLDLPKNPQAVENLRLYMPAEKAPSDSTPPELIFKKDPKGQTTLPFAKTPREETEFARIWNEDAERTGTPKVGTGEIPDPPKGWQGGTPRETRGAYDPRSPGRLFMPAAYHGTPHTFKAEEGAPLGRFRSAQIGSGEGAQAYGHGLYFAGKREVAEHYRKELSQGELLTIKKGSKIIARGDEIDPVGLEAVKFLEIGEKQAGEFKHNKAYYAKKLTSDPKILSRIDEWKDAKISYERPPGSLYKVKLAPKENEYLLWDKPLSEQPKGVREKLEEIIDQEHYGTTLRDRFESGISGEDWKYQEEGADLYLGLSQVIKGDPAASAALLEAGIPGIKYLEGASRAKGKGDYNYVIFDEGDVTITDKLFMPAAPEDASPNTVSSWGDGDSPSFPAGYRRGQAPSNEEVAKLFQEKYVERYGEPIDPYDYGPETLDWLADMVASEGEAALQRTGSAVDWYTTAVERAMSIAEEIFPEIKTSKQAKDRFLGALAITSQNMRVLDNAKAAVYQYEYKAKHGKFDYEIDHGGKAPAITKNLRAFDKMESGMTDFHGFLDRDYTVRELTQFGKKFFGDEKFAIDGRMDDVVKGSAVFGPKIGQGFFQNLKGNYDPVTIDLWLRRTFGRLTGRSVDVSLSPQAIGRLIYSHRKNTGRRKTDFELPEFLRGLKISGSIAKDGKMNFKISDKTFERLFGEHEKGAANADAVFKLAGRLSKEWERRFAAAGRSVTKAKADLQGRKKAGRPTKQASARLSKAEAEKAKIQAEKPYWAYAATSISGKLKPIDIPTPQERTVIVQAFNKALAKLREKGYDLTPADLQATLWYPEKDIWSFLKGDKADALNMSYDQAMEKIRDAR